MISKNFRVVFIIGILAAILLTLYGGTKTYQGAPPYPGKVVGSGGETLIDKEGILRGQATFQRYGLMDLGSVWGHGTYRGTEFTADTLHRVGQKMRDYYAQQKGTSYAALSDDDRAVIDSRVIREIKKNNYDPASDTLTLIPAETYAYNQIIDYNDRVFSAGLKEANIVAGAIKDQADRRALAGFFYWTAWAAGTLRPGTELTYTNNWPGGPERGHVLATSALTWTIFSVIAFFVFFGLIIAIFHWFGYHGGKHDHDICAAQRLCGAPITVSQIKSVKYFLVVVALFLVQTLFGGLMAHYTVHAGQFYGFDQIPKIFPYNWAKSWHLQLPIFWIALAWIGSTIYLAPLVGGKEPKKQGLLVDLLFVAALLVAVGSLTGEVLGVKTGGGKYWFWLAHQGWEHLELGRLWQILLFAGLGIWLLIVARGLAPTFARGRDKWGIPHFLGYSAVAVVGFFGFGLLYNPRTHLTIADFWRWWVVHTWVEGMFEFFTAAAIAIATVAVGLCRPKDAIRAAYLTALLAMVTGIVGVGHHYYWFGAPSIWLAIGGVLSAMEPVPIILLLGKAWQEYKSIKDAGHDFPHTWPLMFITASAVWAFIGAGLFGFLITTPMVNYYEHSTYLTVNHGHTALFGTYGMLAIGLMLFALRGLVKHGAWRDGLIKLSFYGLNIGLFLMAIGTLLPVGILQVTDSFTNGLWHARSPVFYEQPLVKFFGTIRLVPDSIIILLGVVPLALFVFYCAFNLKKAGEVTACAWDDVAGLTDNVQSIRSELKGGV
ncbi:MAG: cbb3-type cytochrome c oxidase subunit I [Armatimonadetes bacterium]|nr:cbb3-type cytochrome c oxidase subunit I [Armatimonadota bacterium]